MNEDSENNSKPVKAIIYSRIASATSTEADSVLAAQTRRCREYAAQQRHEVVATFQDHAGGSDHARSGLHAMFAFLRGRPDREPIVVIVEEPVRLARDWNTYIELKAAIREAGGLLSSPNLNFDGEPTLPSPGVS